MMISLRQWQVSVIDATRETDSLETPRRLLRRFKSVEESFENVGEVKV